MTPTGLLEVGNVSHPYRSQATIHLAGSPLDPPLDLPNTFGAVTKVGAYCETVLVIILHSCLHYKL